MLTKVQTHHAHLHTQEQRHHANLHAWGCRHPYTHGEQTHHSDLPYSMWTSCCHGCVRGSVHAQHAARTATKHKLMRLCMCVQLAGMASQARIAVPEKGTRCEMDVCLVQGSSDCHQRNTHHSNVKMEKIGDLCPLVHTHMVIWSHSLGHTNLVIWTLSLDRTHLVTLIWSLGHTHLVTQVSWLIKPPGSHHCFHPCLYGTP
jgi:microcompartment protein CcmK/EutM